MHTFLVPASELLFLSCQYGDYKDGNFVIVCREDGFAMELEADFMAFKMRILRTTETWQQMLKLSIRSRLEGFTRRKERQRTFSNDGHHE